MWTVTITSTQFADDRLASLAVESPLNLHTKEGLGLLVGLWCGRLHGEVQTIHGPLLFSVGFQVGEVVVEPRGGQISNRGRLQTSVGHAKVSLSETDQVKKAGAIGGRLGVNLAKWISSPAKADLDVGGKVERSTAHSEHTSREYIQHYWRVADAGHNFWRVYGLGLNQENVLEHKIIGDEPLCHILPELDSEAIDVCVTFRCSLRDLWFQAVKSSQRPLDLRFTASQAELNRAAVAGRIAALALNRALDSQENIEGNLVLARQALRAELQKKQKRSHD
ncbi:hypothetical protein [Bradyrhizobium sp. HKCCYLS2033]|uniref:hypothetical protein n=1 Tax=Bradyrhizobium sp. HKCCYLS2033 TaxID=3420739 RepID=UPI003EBBB9D8